MKTKLLTGLSVAAFSLMMLSSCKKEDEQLNNISAYRGDASQAQTVDYADINSSMVFEDRVNGVDYLITKDIQINAAVTVKPGVTFMFKDGAGFTVTEMVALKLWVPMATRYTLPRKVASVVVGKVLPF